MSCNYIYIQIKNNSYINFMGNKNEILKLSLGNNIIPNYSYTSNISKKISLSNKFIFKLKADPSRGYMNHNFDIIYNKNLIKKNEAKMKYKTYGSNKEIKIFNQNFISKNIKRAKVFINNKQYDLKENFESKINNIRIKFFDNIIYLNSMFKDCESLSSVLLNFNTKYFKTIHDLFYGCKSLLIIEDISNILNKDYIKNYINDYIYFNDRFSQRPKLENPLNILEWKISNIIDISGIFYDCKSLKELPNISNWDTSNVINMSFLFYYCSSLKLLPDISKWNISNAKNISGLFDGCSSLEKIPNISRWETKQIEKMHSLFRNCSKIKYILDISNWNIIKIKDIHEIFLGCSNLESLPDIYRSI